MAFVLMPFRYLLSCYGSVACVYQVIFLILRVGKGFKLVE